MNRLLQFIALSLVSTSVLAQSSSTVTVPAQKSYQNQVYMSPEEFKQYKGDYNLSNGEQLILSRSYGKMYAQVGQQAQHQIVAGSNGRFTAPDGSMSMQLEFAANGDVSGQLSYVPETAKLSASEVVTLRIAAR